MSPIAGNRLTTGDTTPRATKSRRLERNSRAGDLGLPGVTRRGSFSTMGHNDQLEAACDTRPQQLFNQSRGDQGQGTPSFELGAKEMNRN